MIVINTPFLYESLPKIEGVELTNRQIDVAACLIGRQKYKTICRILDIAPNTLAEHLRKLRSAIQYSTFNTQIDILDFLETSREYQSLKNHYVQLLIQHAFENALHTISNQLFISRGCIINYHVDIKKNDPLNKKLRKHLKLANINFKIAKSADPDDYIIHVIPIKILSQLTSTDKSNKKTILVAQDPVGIKNRINTEEQYKLSSGYYDAFFKLLEIIFSNSKIATYGDEFNHKKQAYENNLFNNDVYLASSNEIDKKEVVEKQEYNKAINIFGKNFYHKVKSKSWLICCLSLIAFFIYTNRIIVFVGRDPNLAAQGEKEQKLTLYLPPRNKRFTGRENTFELIKNSLNQSNIGIITQAIAGAGGIGKTQLATEYAYQAIENNEYDAVLWVTAENDDSINKAYGEFADSLQISVNGLDPMQLREGVHNVLLERHRISKILFILDNVPDRHDIRKYLTELHNQWPASTSLHVLITSRSQHWIEDLLILDIFIGKEAELFVKKHLPDTQEQEINKLVTELHNYPLALSQAVSYIKQHTNIKDYLKLYLSRKQKYLDILSMEHDQYKQTLWQTISITLGELSNEAKEILYLSAYLAPDNIALKLFVNLSIEEVDKAVRELRKHSLIILTKNREAFKIHRLLQEIIRIYIQKNPIWVDKIVGMAVQSAKDLDLDSKGAWDKIKHWLYHISTLQQYMDKNLDTAKMLHDYGLTSIFFGLNNLASKFYTFALEIKEECYQSKTNIEFNTTLNNLGYIELTLGNYTKAKEFLDQALKVLESHYSDPNDFNLYVTLSNLGRIELYLGNYKVAKKLLKRALRGVEEHYQDPAHINLRYPLNNLGLVALSLGDYQQAKETFERTLKILEKHYKDFNHMEFGAPLYSLGLTEAALGNYEISLKYLNRAYEIYNQHYKGRLHENVFFMYSPIMPWYKVHLKNKEKAIKYYQDSLAIMKKTFGRGHYFVARYYYLLGQAYEINNHPRKAKHQYQQSLDIAKIADIRIKNKAIRAEHQKNMHLLSKLITKKIV